MNCGKCGNKYLPEMDGAKVIDGMPGIKYAVCNNCGWTRAIVKRPTKRDGIRAITPRGKRGQG
jgi:DNA-directed RNA polymerase subunit RPC12/RpoP